MNIIIVGCGKVGYAIAQQLYQEDHDLVVIDTDQSALDNISDSLDIMCVHGNGVSVPVLEEAEAKTTDLLIAVTNADEINLFCCLIARKCGTAHTIARVRNPEYSDGLKLIKEDLGLSMVINPEFIAALEIAKLVKFPSAIEIDSFSRGLVELFKISVPADSLLDGAMLKDTQLLNKFNLRVCGIERDNDVYIPSGDFVIKSGDKASIIGKRQNIGKFCKKIGVLADKSRSAMIIGGGKIGFYLAKQLLSAGVQVKIIELNAERCQFLGEHLSEAVIVQGDGMNQFLLLEEGIENTNVFVSLTDFDEENILLSLYANSVSKCKVITKINRLAFESVIEKMPLGSVVHPKFLTAEYIVSYVRGMQNSFGSNIETLYNIYGGRAEALEFRVREQSAVIGAMLTDLNLKSNLQVACINRGGKTIIPSGADTIEVGDTVVIITTHTGLKDIKDILK